MVDTSWPLIATRPGCEAAERRLTAVPRGRATLGAVRLLVVEDEARLAAALRRGLEAEGFAVDVAPTGRPGWTPPGTVTTTRWCWT